MATFIIIETILILVITDSSTNHSFFTPSSKWMSYTEAQTFCEVHCNSNLVSIHNNETNHALLHYIRIILNSSAGFWIGLDILSGEFKWTDGTILDYGNDTSGGINNYPWNNWQPSNSQGIESCVGIAPWSNYRWNDQECAGPLLTICNECNPTYVLIPSELSWNNADQYCNNHCISDLASIHDTIHAQSISYLAKMYSLNRDVWIGMYRSNETLWSLQWKDKMTKDWGWTWSQYPWATDQPSGYATNKDCVQVGHDNGYLWKSDNCVHMQPFFCQRCDGKLNKYILVPQSLTYTDAQQYCNQMYSTDLAIIRTERDIQEIDLLLKLHTMENSWIRFIDIQWNGQPIPGDCVYYIGDAASNVGCDVLRESFICNAPSKLCSNTNVNWEYLMNQNSFHRYPISDCKIDCNNDDIWNSSMAMITNKQWVNGVDGILLIEYTFIIHALHNNDMSDDTGIFITSQFQLMCDYYYIGVSVTENKIFLRRNYNGTVIELFSSSFPVQFNKDYALQIIAIHNKNFTVTVNNVEYIHYFVNEQQIQIGNLYSGYIGLINSNMHITATSLYVSGGEVNASANVELLLKQCVYQPTPIHISITFNYHIKDGSNPTIKQIKEILFNITEHLLHTEIQSVAALSCVRYNINFSEAVNFQQAVVNSTMVTCNKDTEYKLREILNQNLELNLKSILESESNDIILIIYDSPNPTSIPTDSSITTIIGSTEYAKMKPDKQNSSAVIILCTVGVIALLCVIVFIFVLIRQLKKNNSAKVFEIEMQLGLSDEEKNSPRAKQQNIIAMTNENNEDDDVIVIEQIITNNLNTNTDHEATKQCTMNKATNMNEINTVTDNDMPNTTQLTVNGEQSHDQLSQMNMMQSMETLVAGTPGNIDPTEFVIEGDSDEEERIAKVTDGGD